MADAFDPYNEWLGIPPEDQPPNHYQLLGIDLYEGDAEKIAQAALSRTETLRTYQLGSHFEASQQLLNQVVQAKLCLLDAEKKAAYDAALKQRLSPPEAPAPTATDSAKIQRPQPTAEEAAEPIRNLDSQPEAEQELGSGEEAEQEEPTFPSTLPDFDAEPRTVRRTGGRKRKARKPAASRVRGGAKRKGRTRAGRGRAGREAEEQPNKEHSLRPAVKIRLAVAAVVLFFFIIAFFVMTYETPDSEVRSLLARAENKMQQGDLAEATRLARQAINIEGVNNLNTAKKLLDAIEDQQRPKVRSLLAEAEFKQFGKQKQSRETKVGSKKQKPKAAQRAKPVVKAKQRAKAERKAKEEAQRKAKAERKATEEAAKDKAKRKTERKTKVTYWPNGQKYKEWSEKNGKFEGFSTEWEENGQKARESHYKNGKLDGRKTGWYENGQKWWEKHYKDGKEEGPWTSWYANGQKAGEGHYKDGKLDGLSAWWDENGNKALEIQYKDGREISRKEF